MATLEVFHMGFAIQSQLGDRTVVYGCRFLQL